MEIEKKEGSGIEMTLKEFRQANKLSQQALADALGISVSSERQYEYGKREPSSAVLERLKAVYGVDLNAPETKKTSRKKKAAPAEKPMQSAAEATVKSLFEKKVDIVIQSPMGGEITAEEILAKLPLPVDKVYIRVDQNAAYWVKGDESGAVNLW